MASGGFLMERRTAVMTAMPRDVVVWQSDGHAKLTYVGIVGWVRDDGLYWVQWFLRGKRTDLNDCFMQPGSCRVIGKIIDGEVRPIDAIYGV